MVLVTARKEMGLSQKEVADALYLSLAFIKHIDEDQIDLIPKKAFIKGYLRSYAKLVNLDPDGVVDLYCPKSKKEKSQVLMRTIRPDAISKISFTGPVLISSLIGLVCLAVIVFFVWYYASPVEEKKPVVVTMTDNIENVARPGVDVVDSDVATNNVAAETFLPAEAPLSAEALLNESPVNESLMFDSMLSERSNSDSTTDDINLPEVLDPQSFRSFTEAETADDIGLEITIERSSIGLTNYITVNAAGNDELVVVFSDDCWLELEDRDGHSLYGDLGRGGDNLTVTGTAPFKLLVGKPNVVSVRFNGDEVDLVPFITAARTAKLVLGETLNQEPVDTE